MPQVQYPFYSAEELLTRLVDNPREIVFLFGSPLSSPETAGGPGVPNVAGIVELIIQALKLPASVNAIRELVKVDPASAYQKGFESLYGERGPDLANAIIRKAVLMARIPNADSEETIAQCTSVNNYEYICQKIQDDQESWYLRSSVQILGKIIAKYERFGKIILTTNFDPLIEVAIAKSSGHYHATVLHGDGSLGASRGRGCHIVYLHGYWFGADTLHTPPQLRQSRPQLRNSLRKLISEKTLVVMAYGGWDDILLQTLSELTEDIDASPDIIWTFYENDRESIVRKYSDLLSKFGRGIGRSRVTMYSGIDVHQFLPALERKLELKKKLAHIFPMPTDDILEKRLGSVWGKDVINGKSVVIFGLVFTNKATAQRAWSMLRKWDLGAKNTSGHIILSVVKEELDRYTIILYPDDRGIPDFYKEKAKAEHGEDAALEVFEVRFYFATFADYWEQTDKKNIIKDIQDGSLTMLNCFYLKDGIPIAVAKRNMSLMKTKVISRNEVTKGTLEFAMTWADPWTGVDRATREKYQHVFTGPKGKGKGK